MIKAITAVAKRHNGNAILHMKYDYFQNPTEPMPSEWETMSASDRYDWLNNKGYWSSGHWEDMVWEDCPTMEPTVVDSDGDTDEITIVCG